MKKLLSTSISVLFLALIFSIYSISEAKTLRELNMENAAKCNKSIFAKIKWKLGEVFGSGFTISIKLQKSCKLSK